MIPLTLRAMIRTPHPDVRGLRRPSLVLVSVLALLAFACAPVLAQAETVYEVEQTQLPGGGGGNNPSSHHNNPGGSESSPGARQSTAPGGNGGTGQLHNQSSQSPNGSSGGTNPSSPGGSSNGHGESGKSDVGNGQSLGSGSVQLGEAQPASSNSGGSSPLVPILIAVAVLAAISVGAVLVRQRRGSAAGFSLKRG
jgi:cobalamin biosynthesis Mg chelatase CobN